MGHYSKKIDYTEFDYFKESMAADIATMSIKLMLVSVKKHVAKILDKLSFYNNHKYLVDTDTKVTQLNTLEGVLFHLLKGDFIYFKRNADDNFLYANGNISEAIDDRHARLLARNVELDDKSAFSQLADLEIHHHDMNEDNILSSEGIGDTIRYIGGLLVGDNVKIFAVKNLKKV